MSIICFSFILTVTPATDVPLLALSDTTTKIQRRQISITLYNVGKTDKICSKEKKKFIGLTGLDK